MDVALQFQSFHFNIPFNIPLLKRETLKPGDSNCKVPEIYGPRLTNKTVAHTTAVPNQAKSLFNQVTGNLLAFL